MEGKGYVSIYVNPTFSAISTSERVDMYIGQVWAMLDGQTRR